MISLLLLMLRLLLILVVATNYFNIFVISICPYKIVLKNESALKIWKLLFVFMMYSILFFENLIYSKGRSELGLELSELLYLTLNSYIVLCAV